MYFHYCLIAVGTIFVVSIIIYFIMKKNNQVSRENIFYLVICTVLSIICAVVAPLTAKRLAKELYFSIHISMIISVLVFIGATIVIFLLLLPVIKKLSSGASNESATSKESLVEQLVDAPIQIKSDPDTTVPDNHTSLAENDLVSTNEDVKPEEPYVASISRTQPIEPEPAVTRAGINDNQADIIHLLDKAIELKSNRDLHGAILNYEAALTLNPDDELKYLILLDLCSLYKKTNQPDSVNKILESSRCDLLDLEKKEDILRNL